MLALALLAGLAVYAVKVMKAGKAANGSNPGSNLPPASASAPVVPVATAPPAPAAPAAVPVSSGPKIQFASLTYDFGKANGDDVVNGLFTFTNVGNARLEVTDVAPSCGCLKVGEWTRTVEAGQAGSIAVRFDTHHYTGFFAKSVFVTCNDASQPKLSLEIKGNIWRPIEVTPPTAVLNLNAESPSNATTIRIVSHLDDPLILSDLTNTSRAFAVELQTNQPGKAYQLIVKTAPPWPRSSVQGQITLKTSATNMPVINLMAWANVLPVVMAIPQVVRLPEAPLTNPFTATIWVQNNGTNTIKLSEPAVNAKGVTARIREDQPGRMSTVMMDFPTGFEIAAGEKVELSVKSTHPLFPTIKVPMMQAPRLAPVAVPSPKPPAQTNSAGK